MQQCKWRFDIYAGAGRPTRQLLGEITEKK